MKMKTILIALAVLLGAGTAAVYVYQDMAKQTPANANKPSEKGGAAKGQNRLAPVVTATAQRGDMDVTVSALGTITARNTVNVKARVDGLLTRVLLQEGQIAKAGEVIAELDARPYQAQLDQALGQWQRDQALLAGAQLDLARYRELLAKDSIARQQLETQEALVKQYQGVVQTDRGVVDNAKLQLEFTKISAPLSGRLGLRQVDVGNMVHASDATGIFVLTQTQPINAIFAVPAEQLPAILTPFQKGEKLVVEAFNREGNIKLASGTLATLDNQIDTTTGTVKLKAEFANADNALFPNQFVNIRLHVATQQGEILIPNAAIQRGTGGSFVYVIKTAPAKDASAKETKVVDTRLVTLGTNNAESVTIKKGLEPGELVVIDGADKLKQGAEVEVASLEKRADSKADKGEKTDNSGQGRANSKARE